MAGIEAAEREFEARLRSFGREARGCAMLAYTEFVLHYYAGSNWPVRDRLNRHPAFWNAVLAGLQSSAFVALGRIFDTKRGTYNGDELLDFAEKHRGIFSRKAREAREVRRGAPLDQARDFAARAVELRAGGLREVRDGFAARQRVFEKRVAPIRHEVFAHASKREIEDREKMFTALPLRELEDLVVFPLRVERALFQFYYNGAPPDLDPAPSLVSEVVKALPEPSVASWEHLHAAKNVVAFLDWLRETPLDED